jgi:stage IV sporulation protein FB
MPADFSRMMGNWQNPGVANAVWTLFVANLSLGLFNLLPAFPMDGGRILRSLLAMALPYVQATRIAVIVGRLMAVLFAVWGIFTGNIWLLLIAFFVYVGGSAEQEAVESRAVLRNVLAGEILPANAAKLYASERLSRSVDLIMTTYQTDYPVFDLAGAFIGVLTKPRLVQALQQFGPEARVVDVMIPADQVPVVSPSSSLAEVWEKMTQKGLRVVAVKRANEFLGLLTVDDLTEVFQVMSATISKDGSPQPEAPQSSVTQQPIDA